MQLLFLFLQHQVAIKSLSKERMENGISDFLKEASMMHGIETDHIVRMYGVVFDRDSLMLVSTMNLQTTVVYHVLFHHSSHIFSRQ